MADRVKLRHKEHGGEWEAPADAVEGWQELGWEPVSAEDKKAAKAASSGKEK